MNSPPFIISASRRTDVPAFYSEWFLERTKQGRAEFKHPYSKQRISVPLTPDRVAAIVFWTKNMTPMMERLKELEDSGFDRYLVHYTVTGLGKSWEPRVPETDEAVEVIKKLSEMIGPERVLWRFDPIVITKKITVEKTLARFGQLCEVLGGHIKRCYTSIMQPYKKIASRIKSYETDNRDAVREPGPDEVIALGSGLAGLARQANIVVHACCTPELIGFGVMPARCVDGDLINELWPGSGLVPEKAPTRKACGCHRSIDIGAYDTCAHLCRYCYANCRDSVIAKRLSSLRPENISMIG